MIGRPALPPHRPRTRLFVLPLEFALLPFPLTLDRPRLDLRLVLLQWLGVLVLGLTSMFVRSDMKPLWKGLL